jgi:ABC-type transport system involved in cytochrome bd biosynthesis fused ATPase/permease subunit
MHPITIIEILIAVGVVLGLLVLVYVLLKKSRRLGLFFILIVALAELVFFAVRPFWINYHVAIKTEQLDEYLEKQYPGEEWEISRRTGRQYGPYQLEVRFENEQGWVYLYSVKEDKIKQVSVGVPDDEYYKAGKHYED